MAAALKSEEKKKKNDTRHTHPVEPKPGTQPQLSAHNTPTAPKPDFSWVLLAYLSPVYVAHLNFYVAVAVAVAGGGDLVFVLVDKPRGGFLQSEP